MWGLGVGRFLGGEGGLVEVVRRGWMECGYIMSCIGAGVGDVSKLK